MDDEMSRKIADRGLYVALSAQALAGRDKAVRAKELRIEMTRALERRAREGLDDLFQAGLLPEPFVREAREADRTDNHVWAVVQYPGGEKATVGFCLHLNEFLSLFGDRVLAWEASRHGPDALVERAWRKGLAALAKQQARLNLAKGEVPGGLLGAIERLDMDRSTLAKNLPRGAPPRL